MTPRSDTTGIASGIVSTFVAHVAMFGLIVLANVTGEDGPPEDAFELPVLSTELLMLGEQMPEEGMLPRIANPEEAPQVDDNPAPPEVPEEETALPDQEEVVLDREPTPEPPEREERREENRPNPEPTPEREAPPRRDRGETNPNRPTNNDPRVGSTEGFAGGTSLSASAQRNQLAPITAQLSRALQRPTAIDDATYRSLSAVVQFRVSEAGRVLDWEIVEPSGNQLFDAAVSRMLNRFKLGSDRLNLSVVTNEAFRDAIVRRGFQTTVQGR
jgi:outer membrane biosynthesis protein TonB